MKHKVRRHVFLKDLMRKRDFQRFSKMLKNYKRGGGTHDEIVKLMQKYDNYDYFSTRFITLIERTLYYNYVSTFLQNLQTESCLEKNDSFALDKSFEYSIQDIVHLEQRFGTKSSNATIYKTSVKDMLGKIPIAAKVTILTELHLHEILINDEISKHILAKSLSKHFVFCYKYFICIEKDQTSQKTNNSYIVALNELANGDLLNLLQTSVFQNAEIALNLIMQCLISIMTFHKLGYVHQDCNEGNFLYHYNHTNTEGYFHYNIRGKDYLLKNCGYNMMLYDMGYAEKYPTTKKRPQFYSWHDEELGKNKIYSQEYNKNDKEREFIYDYYDYRVFMKPFKRYGTRCISENLKPFIDKLWDLTAPNIFHNEDELIDEILKLFHAQGVLIDKKQDTNVQIIESYVIDNTLSKHIHHKKINDEISKLIMIPAPPIPVSPTYTSPQVLTKRRNLQSLPYTQTKKQNLQLSPRAESHTILNSPIYFPSQSSSSQIEKSSSNALTSRPLQSNALPPRPPQSNALPQRPPRPQQSNALPPRPLQSNALPTRSLQSNALPPRSPIPPQSNNVLQYRSPPSTAPQSRSPPSTARQRRPTRFMRPDNSSFAKVPSLDD